MTQPSKSSEGDSRSRVAQRVTADEQLFISPFRERVPFTQTDPWRVLRIMGEFVAGFDELADIGAAVTIFGSARSQPGDPMYDLAVETSRRLGKQGFSILTGAGPGIMEAANRGARDVGALSIGLNIELPAEQYANKFLDRVVDFRYFFIRKTMLVKYSSAFVIFPGGFGTMDELFESLTLIQTGKVRHMPVVLFGSAYWKGLFEWMKSALLAEGKISPEDLDIFQVVDDPDDVVKIVVEARNGENDQSIP